MSIESDTAMLPHVIASVVVGDWIAWLDKNEADLAQKVEDKSRELIVYLVGKAEWHYGHAMHFRSVMQSKRSNRARDMLYAFMYHWMTAGMLRSFPRLRGSVPPHLNGTGSFV